MTDTQGLASRVAISLGLVVAGTVLTVALAAIAAPWEAAAVGLAAAGVFVTVRRPGILFAAYLLIPFYKAASQPYMPVDVTVVLALLVSLQVIPLLRDRGPRAVSTGGLVAWVAFGLVMAAGIAYAPDQGLALGDTIAFTVLAFVPLTVGALRVGAEPRHLRDLLLTCLAVGVLVTILGLAQLSTASRLEVLNQNTIQTALAALLVPILAVYLVGPSRSVLVRALAVVISVAAIIVALASGSRGPVLILALLAVLGILRYLLHPRTASLRAAATVTGVILASTAVLAIVADELPEASTARFVVFGEFIEEALAGNVGGGGDTSAGERVILFAAAVDLIEQHPVLGVGTSGFEALNPIILGPSAQDEYPHNALLQIGANHGLIGMALFVTLALLAATRRLPQRGDCRALRVLFLYFLINSMVSGNVFEERSLLGLMLLVLCVDVVRFRDRGPDVEPEWSDPQPPQDWVSGGPDVPWYLQPPPEIDGPLSR